MASSGRDSFDPQDFLEIVGVGKTISKFHKDQIIFSQGEAADAVFYIQKGRVKVVVISDQGKEAVVGILEAGQFFGEGCLNGHHLRIATTTAMEECLITAIGKSTMIAVLQFERKAPRPTSIVAGEFRQGRQSDADQSEYQSRDVG